jgi:hypothetical protein
VLGACSSPALSPGDARTFTGRALRHAGLHDVRVASTVQPVRCGRPLTDGWRVRARVAGGTVVLCVGRHGSEAAAVDDRADGQGRASLLTADQLRELDRFADDVPGTRRARLVLAPIAAVLCLLAAAALWRSRARRVG